MDSYRSDRKLLMVLGPVEMEKEISDLGSSDMRYMRTKDFSALLGKVFCGLKYVFKTENPVLMFASSGTGAMEAAVSNFLSRSDRALYVNGGTFGARWGDICRAHAIPAEEIRVPFGDSVKLAQIKNAFAKKRFSALLTTLDETSSGALTDIASIGRYLKREHPEVLFIVDCVSGLVADKFLADEWGVDVAVSASQKGLALPPGLGFMSVSEKALKFAENVKERPFYFDVFIYLENWRRNQTPFTPSVGIILQLARRLEKIQSRSLERLQKDYLCKTDLLRDGLKKLGFKVLAKSPANCVTAINSGRYDASKIVDIMRNKYNIEITPSGGEMKTSVFRVGNFGAIGTAQIKRMLSALEKTLKELENDR